MIIQIVTDLLAPFRPPSHFPRNQTFNMSQFLHDFLLKPVFIAVGLTLEKTGEHFSDEPAERTMRRNGGRIWFCCV